MKVRACRVLGHARALYNGAVSYGHSQVCHIERAAGESRNLRIPLRFRDKLVRRSLHALRLVGMTALQVTCKQCDKPKSGFIVPLAPKAQKLLPGEKLAKIFDF